MKRSTNEVLDNLQIMRFTGQTFLNASFQALSGSGSLFLLLIHTLENSYLRESKMRETKRDKLEVDHDCDT